MATRALPYGRSWHSSSRSRSSRCLGAAAVFSAGQCGEVRFAAAQCGLNRAGTTLTCKPASP